MIKEVPMYRIICDEDGCDRSPSDDAEFYAWSDKDGALLDLENAYEWYWNDDQHLCPDHRPRCSNEDCAMWLTPEDVDGRCEDCTSVAPVVCSPTPEPVEEHA